MLSIVLEVCRGDGFVTLRNFDFRGHVLEDC